MCCIWFIT